MARSLSLRNCPRGVGWGESSVTESSPDSDRSTRRPDLWAIRLPGSGEGLWITDAWRSWLTWRNWLPTVKKITHFPSHAKHINLAGEKSMYKKQNFKVLEVNTEWIVLWSIAGLLTEIYLTEHKKHTSQRDILTELTSLFDIIRHSFGLRSSCFKAYGFVFFWASTTHFVISLPSTPTLCTFSS